MRKIYFLATCSTCHRIMDELNIDEHNFEQQDIKTEQITKAQLAQLKKLAGSYENLFSRRAMKYKSMKLKDKKLTEKDYEKLILSEYTFLKRPVLIIDDQIFVGSSKKVVLAAQDVLGILH